MSETFKKEDRYFHEKIKSLEDMIVDVGQTYPERGKLLLIGLKQAKRELDDMRIEQAHGTLSKD